MAYHNYDEALKALSRQKTEDREWATANAAPVTEGPWAGIDAEQVFYIGVNQAGERIKLQQIPNLWRYRPNPIQIPVAKEPPAAYSVDPTGPIVVRIELGRTMPGILLERPQGNQPVQTTGQIDGKDFYFRERDGFWSLSIGGANVIGQPDWYYEEGQYTLDVPSNDAAYNFIARAADIFRSGRPTMAPNTLRQENSGNEENNP